ncbi:DUF2501 domain-containing protein [Enterobacillus tribolii]|uniref:Uncharacterized protein DUF2501 n=1 Tax=Enterobacillus tribolii TaxID=1487935 RepID=A0A370R5S3_9GAMM|nr:DUF2501 domain-containing protein [Enterobacillus tribolii]MBW7983405.1 DUF2501 domain-containing protein [Enterobacillus tribolii]RDK97465.1 uncharacterized protein DUF2501 [Enterobacillus tribolii]
MKSLMKPLMVALLFATTGAGAAQTDLLGAVKSLTGTQGAETAAGSASGMSGTLKTLLGSNASSLQSSSITNAGGVLQYCVKNNVLSATDSKVSAIKDKLMGKLGDQTESKPYTDGLNGILNMKDGKQVDLNNLGSVTSSLKQKATTKVCDVVLNQAKNFL